MSTPLKDLLRERRMTLSDLADRVGVDKATVSRWAKRQIPAERVIAVETATGIPRAQLRPDLYPDAPGAAGNGDPHHRSYEASA